MAAKKKAEEERVSSDAALYSTIFFLALLIMVVFMCTAGVQVSIVDRRLDADDVRQTFILAKEGQVKLQDQVDKLTKSLQIITEKMAEEKKDVESQSRVLQKRR